MTKKSVLLTSLVLLFISIIIDPYILGFCITDDKYCIFGSLAHLIGKPMFYIFSSLFLVSIITYKMREEVFKLWLKFTYVWVPLTILLVLISPEYGNSFFPIVKGSVSFFMSCLFLLISLIIIISKSLSLRKK